jgi:hypothetical protein
LSYQSLLTAYQPSYFIWVVSGEPRIQFYLSVKYPLFRNAGDSMPYMADLKRFFGDHHVGEFTDYFVYNGQYDFLIRRYSAPVVSRIQNPGFLVDHALPWAEDWQGHEVWHLYYGYFHESNGQIIGDRATYLATDHAEDFVSRGWDYALAQVHAEGETVRPSGAVLGYEFNLGPRMYLPWQGMGLGGGVEEDDFWEALPRHPKRSQFDGLRASLVLHNDSVRLAEELRVGDWDWASVGNVSSQLEFTARFLKYFPLTLVWFDGYGRTLAMYQQRDWYAGVGLELW